MVIKRQKKSQISLEYVIVLGFLITIIGVTAVVGYVYLNRAKVQMMLNQVDSAGNKIAHTAESIYFLGEPAKTTLEVYFPRGIEDISFYPESKEIIFTMSAEKGEVIKFIYVTKVPVNGSIRGSPGKKHIVIEAKETYVDVTE